MYVHTILLSSYQEEYYVICNKKVKNKAIDAAFHCKNTKTLVMMQDSDTDNKILTYYNEQDISKAKEHYNRILYTCGVNIHHIPSLSKLSVIYESNTYLHLTNCYAFATDILLCKTNRHNKNGHTLQPGQLYGLQPLRSQDFTQEDLVTRVLLDHPTARWIANTDSEYKQSQKTEYCNGWKVYFYLTDLSTINDQKNRDYHFVKEFLYGYVHKRGKSHIYLTDASGNYIFDPDQADFDYRKHGGLNYGLPKGYFVFQSI